MFSTWAQTRWLLGLSILFLAALLPFSTYIVAIPYLQAEWKISNLSSGIIFSSYLLGYAASSLLVVPLTDRFSIQGVLLLGLVIMFAGHLLFPVVAHDLYSASLARAVAGAGHVAAYQSAIRLVSLQFPAQSRGRAVGLFVAFGYGGTTLSYSITGQLLAHLGSWRMAYLYIALVGPIALLALYFALFGGSSWRPRQGIMRVDTVEPKKGWLLDLSVLRDHAITLTTLAYALHTAELYLARLWFPLLLTSSYLLSGDSIEAASVRSATVSGPMFMLGIVGVFAGGYLSDHVGRVRGAMFIFLSSGICSFLVGWLVAAPTLLLVAGFIYGFATAADSAILSAAIIELSPPDRVGSAQAVQSFIGFVMGAALPVLAGFILDHSAAEWRWIIAFSVNGLLALLGIVVLERLARLRPAAAKVVA